MNFIITCGGTGGHIYPGVAVAQRLRREMPDCGILFVGCIGNMEMELVPREGFEIKGIAARSLHRSFSPRDIVHNIGGVFVNAASVSASKRILREFRADAAVGTGGYVCWPVLKAAASLKIPTILHESNAFPGLTTRLLEPVCDRILVNFDECRKYYKKPEKLVVVGMPVRSAFLTARRAQRPPNALPRLVSLWGSLGASKMNELTAGIIARNEKNGTFTHLHATGGGEAGVAKMRRRLTELGVGELRYTELRPFIYDMPGAMADADLVMNRAGTSTLGEMSAIGAPALLVPSVNVTHNHQEANARVAEGRGGAIVMLESQCSPDAMYNTIRSTLRDRAKLDAMSAGMRSLARDDAAGLIVSETMKVIAARGN